MERKLIAIQTLNQIEPLLGIPRKEPKRVIQKTDSIFPSQKHHDTARKTTVTDPDRETYQHQDRERVGEGERKKKMQDPSGAAKTPEKWSLHLSCGCKQHKKRTPPINPGTGETAWVNWGGCDLSQGQTAIMIVVKRVTMNPAHPTGRAPACSRDDSQQETGDPEHASARPEGAGIHCGRKYRRVLFS